MGFTLVPSEKSKQQFSRYKCMYKINLVGGPNSSSFKQMVGEAVYSPHAYYLNITFFPYLDT